VSLRVGGGARKETHKPGNALIAGSFSPCASASLRE
jgi:hypothetical protein